MFHDYGEIKQDEYTYKIQIYDWAKKIDEIKKYFKNNTIHIKNLIDKCLDHYWHLKIFYSRNPIDTRRYMEFPIPKGKDSMGPLAVDIYDYEVHGSRLDDYVHTEDTIPYTPDLFTIYEIYVDRSKNEIYIAAIPINIYLYYNCIYGGALNPAIVETLKHTKNKKHAEMSLKLYKDDICPIKYKKKYAIYEQLKSIAKKHKLKF